MINRAIVLAALFCVTGANALCDAQEASPQFKQLDKNSDGQLTKDEFSGPLFDRIDSNRDGVVTVEEDQAFMRAFARPGGNRNSNRNNNNRNNGVPETVTAELDIPYAGTDNPRQRLDLYLPRERKNDKPLPVVVFIHGGAWQAGDKRGGFRMISSLVESGQYAGASLGYRLSGEAKWPAQMHDCKAAIRWIKANAEKYNLDPNKIGVTGTSAGGHLVAMLGTAGNVKELEGDLGDHPDQSSEVACVVDQFGPTDLLSMGGWHDNPDSPESNLVGGPIQDNKDAARNASPTSYVSKEDPPFLFIHGTEDRTVPFDQSTQLHEALKVVGVESTLVPVEGGGHGGFPGDAVAERLKQFFGKYLHGEDNQISSDPIKQSE